MNNITVLVTFIIYFIIMMGIGIYFFRKNSNMSDYFLGGRQLNSWVTALSAQASDMSGWLLMGLPAAAYLSGLSAGWIAIGLALGTYLNWKFIAKPLRKFTAVSGDSITIPQYLQNRFLSKSNGVRSVCAIFIFIFFLIYTASAFNAGAKLLVNVFGFNYTLALTIGAIVIIAYTFLGGFLAVCWTDFVQGIIMFITIIVVPIIAILNTPDLTLQTLSELKDGTLLNIFATTDGKLSIISIISSLAWALGYFGMPHILTRFMAIRSSEMIKKSRMIAIIWVVVSLAASVAVGVIGFAYMESIGVVYASKSSAEVIFMDLVLKLTPGLLSGVLLSAILAAVMSTADSQLLVTASAVSNDLYKVLFRKKASDKELMWVSRIAVLAIALLAYLIAFNPENSVMDLVSYAWAGLGAAFGPTIISSLFWRRITMKGATSGIIIGGGLVLIWETLKLESSTGIYSIIPAFILAIVVIIIVSLLDEKPSKEIEDLFDKAKSIDI